MERDAAISGNTISGNGYAFAGSIAISELIFANNTISGNTHGTDLVVTGGAITANTTWANLGGNRTIQVTAAVTVQEGATLTIGSGVVVYVSSSAARLVVNDNAVLSIGAGAIFKFVKFTSSSPYASLYVNGRYWPMERAAPRLILPPIGTMVKRWRQHQRGQRL